MPSRFVPTGAYPNIGQGSRSFSDLRDEFGDTDPISLSEYYKGGGLTTDSAADYFPGLDGNPFPTSGKISLGVFSSKPYWDQTFIPSASGITTDFTITLPPNTGYSHMACWIQGSGGSGMISNGNSYSDNGWGSGVAAGYYSPRAGGNAGNFAIKRTTAISSGQTITVRVGAGGVPSSNGNGIVGSAYTYNSTGSVGSLGMNGDAINGAEGATSYIKLDGADVLVVPGGKRGVTGSRRTWVDEQQSPMTYTRYCEPPSPDATGVIGADAVYIGGKGGMGRSPYTTMNSQGQLGNMSWSGQSAQEFGVGGGVSVWQFPAAGGDIPTYYSGDTIRGTGQKFDTTSSNTGSLKTFAAWATYGNAPSPHYYLRGLTTLCVNQNFQSGGIYGAGGSGIPASGSSVQLQSAKGGDAFARIMFYDQNSPYHTVGNAAQLSPNSSSWT